MTLSPFRPAPRPVDPRLVEALRVTARRLERGAGFRWTHMGSCNCGHLAQTVTRLSAAEIHRRALERPGDWSQQTARATRHPQEIELCPSSGATLDSVIDSLLALGLERVDLRHLEYLSDRRVLRNLPVERRVLDKRRRDDVVLYLRTWAEMLEDDWMTTQSVPSRLTEREASPSAPRSPHRALTAHAGA